MCSILCHVSVSLNMCSILCHLVVSLGIPVLILSFLFEMVAPLSKQLSNAAFNIDVMLVLAAATIFL